jgi:molybdenum cofactor cytidylyltransferase
MGLAGVILAAGESSRMGRDKALLPWPPDSSAIHGVPHTLVRAAAPGSPTLAAQGAAGRVRAPVPTRAVASSGVLLSAAIQACTPFCDLVIVVAGKNEPAIAPVVYGCGAFLVRNPNPEQGQFSSLQTGLRAVLSRGRDKAMIMLVDRPPPTADTLNYLVDSFTTRNHAIWAVVPEFQGKHGHPILAGREMIEEFLRAHVTANAREIEHTHQQRISYLRIDDPLVTTNVDTPEDYASLKSQRS